MVGRIFALAVGLMTSASALGSTVPDPLDPVQAQITYKACIRSGSRHFENAKLDPAEIVTVAEAACRLEYLNLQRAADRQPDWSPTRRVAYVLATVRLVRSLTIERIKVLRALPPSN